MEETIDQMEVRIFTWLDNEFKKDLSYTNFCMIQQQFAVSLYLLRNILENENKKLIL